ncbi:EAL domain-containing protein [Reinekea sp.]|jgi:diguanylate cyclase (GGDEF)-like protein|uniref:EAL domain-containing response regulator n=1 Tax=Reinekea sp. TaxID=1970455 RepID=UPI002A81A1E9|nr:EAL domain-containing protein [Reinekea sp.]
MSTSSSSAIRILLIHDTQNAAEPVANAIRNSGQAVRSHFIASLDELNRVIEEQTWDLMLAKLNTATVDATEAVATIQRDGKDIPMIGLIDAYNDDIIASALDMGMADVVVESSLQHLAQAVKREVGALKARRDLRSQSVSLRETEKRCQLLLESSVDAIGYVHEGMHIYANPNYMQLFGYLDIEDLQCTPIMDLVNGPSVSGLRIALKGFKDGKVHQLNSIGQHTDGSTFDIHLAFSAASYEGERCTQVIIRKQEPNNEALEEKIRTISFQDPVTGLYNKSYFNEQLDQAYEQVLSQAKRQIVAHIGIANFVDIKVAVGLAGTDLLLKQLAAKLREKAFPDAVFARYSDDMFAMIAPTSDLEAIQQYWQTMQTAISDHLFEVDGRTLKVNLICGFAHMDEAGKAGNEALVQADQAYNNALKQHKTQAYFDKSDIANLADNSIIAKLEHALDHDGMRIQFQPIMSLRGDDREHYDILVRLRDKDGSELVPDDFLPSIENSELSGKLDRWVVARSITALSDHRKQGHNTQLMIHLTAASIQDPTFLPWVNSQLRIGKLPGDSICFQITENVAHRYLKAAKAFSKGLSLLKCQLSINQFGLAENGFALTQHLDISYARIHDDLVSELVDKGQASPALAELFTEIHRNDINSIVPKIENSEILAALWELGVNYIQGYYLQAPLDDMEYSFDSDEDEEATQ